MHVWTFTGDSILNGTKTQTIANKTKMPVFMSVEKLRQQHRLHQIQWNLFKSHLPISKLRIWNVHLGRSALFQIATNRKGGWERKKKISCEQWKVGKSTKTLRYQFIILLFVYDFVSFQKYRMNKAETETQKEREREREEKCMEKIWMEQCNQSPVVCYTWAYKMLFVIYFIVWNPMQTVNRNVLQIFNAMMWKTTENFWRYLNFQEMELKEKKTDQTMQW